MIKTINITLLSLLLCLGAMGQTKPTADSCDTCISVNMFTNGAVGYRDFRTFNPNKSDTTECWFKGAFIISDTEVVEKWIKGYKVVFPYKSIPISSLASYRHPENEYFLWADKKRFNQTVVAVIETH